MKVLLSIALFAAAATAMGRSLDRQTANVLPTLDPANAMEIYNAFIQAKDACVDEEEVNILSLHSSVGLLLASICLSKALKAPRPCWIAQKAS